MYSSTDIKLKNTMRVFNTKLSMPNNQGQTQDNISEGGGGRRNVKCSFTNCIFVTI